MLRLLCISMLAWTLACDSPSSTSDAGVDATDITVDANEFDVSPDANASGCEAFCNAEVLTTLNDCFAEGEPIETAECVAVCEEDMLADARECVLDAEDCDAVDACFGFDEESASFEIRETDAIMSGVIDGTTPSVVAALLRDHPEVTRIVLLDCPGSGDDEANLEAARMIRAAALATHIPADGIAASGAVDFFTAGTTRTIDVEGGARVGVHSWANGATEGADVPVDDPQHQLYLEFYREMGIPEDFYWFTLSAAPAAGIHWMTREEVDLYELETSD